MNWFETIVVTKKREDIVNLIKQLMLSSNKNLELPEIQLPTENGKLIALPDFTEEHGEFEDDDTNTENTEVSIDTTVGLASTVQFMHRIRYIIYHSLLAIQLEQRLPQPETPQPEAPQTDQPPRLADEVKQTPPEPAPTVADQSKLKKRSFSLKKVDKSLEKNEAASKKRKV